MKVVGIDLSMRSTGIVELTDGKLTRFDIFDPPPTIKDEALFIKNANSVADFIENSTPDLIVMEGFSFGALSGEKDKIAGNFWAVRVELFKRSLIPTIPVKVIPVTTWRSPLFNKAERDALRDATKQLKADKVPTKGLKGEERKAAMLANKTLEQAASIKEATLRKLPEDVRGLFQQYLLMTDRSKEQVYDLTDAYFIARHFM